MSPDVDPRLRGPTVNGTVQYLSEAPHWQASGKTVTTAQGYTWNDKLGRTDGPSRIVYLPVEDPTSFVRLYHELGHLAIQVRDERGADVPVTREEDCSLLALSRILPERIDEDRVPYFGSASVSQTEWPDIVERVLAYREDHHDSIQQARRWFGLEDGDRDD